MTIFLQKEKKVGTTIDWEKFDQILGQCNIKDYAKTGHHRIGIAIVKFSGTLQKNHFSFMIFPDDPIRASLIFVLDEPWKRARKPWTRVGITQCEARQENLFRTMVDALSQQMIPEKPKLYHYEGSQQSFAATWGEDSLSVDHRTPL